MELDDMVGPGGPGAVPAGVTHGPSRELLEAGELAWRYAHLDLRATSEGPLRAAADWYGEHLADGPDGLFVLGEAQYSDGDDPVDVLLDGASGEVHLACLDQDDALRRDLLASSPQALIALVTVVESLTLAALGGWTPAEGEAAPPYGPGTVAAAVRIGLDELRAADPGLWERTGGRPAHWETALRIRALAWGAERGKPGGPAYAVEPELVEDLARLTGGGEVRRFAPEDLPDLLEHAPTRRLLLEVGLPLGGRSVLSVAADGPLTAVEADAADGHLELGGWMYDLDAAVDGTTGQVALPDWDEDGGPASYLHRDLATLLYTLWTYERLRAERSRWDDRSAALPWSAFHPYRLLDGAAVEVLSALDPAAWSDDSLFWPMRADDGHMGDLLE